MREHPATSGFTNTGVPEDEGQHLQSVFPPAKRFGGPGRFAFDPRAHLTEHSELNSVESKTRLLREWGAYFDLDKTMFLEKSPPNLIRSRFLQALFPDAKFIFIIRHPIPVTFATQKWSNTSVTELLLHWCIAHKIMLEDLVSIKQSIIFRYEDFVRTPSTYLDKVYQLAGLERYICQERVMNYNDNYFSLWEEHDSLMKMIIKEIINFDDGLLQKFGYSLSKPYVNDDSALEGQK